jgi:flagellar hook-length control protein FliK
MVIVINGPTIRVNVPVVNPTPVYNGPSEAEIEAGKRAAVEEALAEKEAADKAAADKAAAEKALADKEAAEKAAAEKADADKAAAEKALADKEAADKAAADKAALEKALADKAAAEKALAEKTASEKAAADKAAADKAAADKATAEKAALDKAAADNLAACILGKSATLVTAKKKTMSLYSQICFVPEMMKPIEKDMAQLSKVIAQIKSKKIKSITLLSFADEKIGVNFKSAAKTRAEMISEIIKRSIPKLKVTYALFGSSTKKNIVSQGRVVITAN